GPCRTLQCRQLLVVPNVAKFHRGEDDQDVFRIERAPYGLLSEESQKSDIQAGGTQYGASGMKEATSFRVQARRNAPGRSCRISNFEVWPGRLPVAVGLSAGFASASLALIAWTFLLLFDPCFFFRCFWFGITALHNSMVQSDFLFSEKIFRISEFYPFSILPSC